ncbi:MAG: ABC transporter ATP-binding protein, partial [Planctomycetales bacterium]|nr:ABC transporter ATP-binding protein [Planctomycetales bacterium]
MNAPAAIDVAHVGHRYGERQALDDVSFTVSTGEIFALLGPNGGGKTTLFRLISTLLPLESGTIMVMGRSVAAEPHAVRQQLGVVFQSPSLDGKLSVDENIRCQGHLYGMCGAGLEARRRVMLERLSLSDRGGDRTETLSGGLQRRVELAKGMIHSPRVLLMDEPTTGLDPGARSELWRLLRTLRDEEHVTIVLTTHLLEEADRVDRLAIIDEGRLVALDTPDALRAQVGGQTIAIETDSPQRLAEQIGGEFAVEAIV